MLTWADPSGFTSNVPALIRFGWLGLSLRQAYQHS